MGTARVWAAAAAARDYIQRNRSQSSATVMGQTSEFWREIFDARENLPPFNRLLGFRRSAVAEGIGEYRGENETEEGAQARRTAGIMNQFVPREWLAGLTEPAYGAPLVYDFDGLPLSASFRLNSGTTYRLSLALKDSGLEDARLDVCEIGAGWGACATQLHQVADISSYTVIDLPENLYLSSVYLSAVLPEREVEFLDVVGPRHAGHRENRVLAMLPGALDRLDCRYDLIFNSFSFQEMDAGTVDAYLGWAVRALQPKGILVSLNSHGKAGIVRSGDYRYGRFCVRRIGVFRRIPSGYFNTIPYEVILAPRQPDSPHFDEGAFSTLADMMQLGLDDELAPYCDALVLDRLSEAQRQLLHAWEAGFAALQDVGRENAWTEAAALDGGPISHFLRGNLRFAMGAWISADEDLAVAEARDLKGFAALRCKVMRHVLAKRLGKESNEIIGLPDDSSIAAVSIYPELEAILSSNDSDKITGHINRVLRRATANAARAASSARDPVRKIASYLAGIRRSL